MILLFGFLPAVVAAAEFYKWVDEMGVTHYSNQPHPGAEVLVLPKEPRPAPSVPASSNVGNKGEPAADGDKGYNRFAITQPENDQTFRNTGTINIAFAISPSLRAGHKIRVSLDGSPLKDELTTIRFSLQGIDRGTHTLSAVIVDASGTQIISAGGVSFHVLKHSVLFKKKGSSNEAAGTGPMYSSNHTPGYTPTEPNYEPAYTP